MRKVLAGLAADPNLAPAAGVWSPVLSDLSPHQAPVAGVADLYDLAAEPDARPRVEVAERVVVDGPHGPIRLAYFITRRDGMSSEEFSRHWSDIHTTFVRQIPGLLRYVQSETVEHSSDRSSYDGVAELWWPDAATYRRDMAGDAVRASYRDERNFIDHSLALALVTGWPTR